MSSAATKSDGEGAKENPIARLTKKALSGLIRVWATVDSRMWPNDWGRCPSWLKGTGCKPVGVSLRRFESYPAHRVFAGYRNALRCVDCRGLTTRERRHARHCGILAPLHPASPRVCRVPARAYLAVGHRRTSDANLARRRRSALRLPQETPPGVTPNGSPRIRPTPRHKELATLARALYTRAR